MLMFVVGEDIRRALAGEPARTSSETERALSTLPTSWYDSAPNGPGNDRGGDTDDNGPNR